MIEFRREIRTITLRVKGKVTIVERVPVLTEKWRLATKPQTSWQASRQASWKAGELSEAKVDEGTRVRLHSGNADFGLELRRVLRCNVQGSRSI